MKKSIVFSINSCFIENLSADSQGFSKQESLRKHFILMCRFTMCESIRGGKPKKKRKIVGLQQRNLLEKSVTFQF